jgi:hypothetical protein
LVSNIATSRVSGMVWLVFLPIQHFPVIILPATVSARSLWSYYKFFLLQLQGVPLALDVGVGGDGLSCQHLPLVLAHLLPHLPHLPGS